MTKRKEPSQKRKPSERQVRSLMALLTLWPEASSRICQKFVLQTLSVKLTRAALQTARQNLGLSTPTHTEVTEKKMLFATLSTALLFKENPSLEPERIRREVRKRIRDQFGEDINTVLLDSAIEKCLDAVTNGLHNVEDIIGETQADLTALGFYKSRQGRQKELL
jgi:hypothetical protein